MTTALCGCGHPREAHEHFRRGHDCGICGAETCPRYRSANRFAPLLARFRPATVRPAARPSPPAQHAEQAPAADGQAPAA